MVHRKKNNPKKNPDGILYLTSKANEPNSPPRFFNLIHNPSVSGHVQLVPIISSVGLHFDNLQPLRHRRPSSRRRTRSQHRRRSHRRRRIHPLLLIGRRRLLDRSDLDAPVSAIIETPRLTRTQHKCSLGLVSLTTLRFEFQREPVAFVFQSDETRRPCDQVRVGRWEDDVEAGVAVVRFAVDVAQDAAGDDLGVVDFLDAQNVLKELERPSQNFSRPERTLPVHRTFSLKINISLKKMK